MSARSAEMLSALSATRKNFFKNVEVRQQLESQLRENEMVLAEVAALSPASVVYKSFGPSLLRQESAEVKSNVKKRIDFILGEIGRVELVIKQLEQQESEFLAKLKQ